jgi:hypothetical protein
VISSRLIDIRSGTVYCRGNIMAIPTPRSWWSRLWRTDLPWDVGSAVAGFATGLSAAFRFFFTDPAVMPDAKLWGWIVLGGVVVAAAMQFGKAIAKWWVQAEDKSVHELAGCLHAVNAVLLGGADPKTVALRSTVWVPDKGQKELVQALDYVGDQRKKKTLGRRMKVEVGAVGKAFLEKTSIYQSRAMDSSVEDFVAQMMKEYQFPEKDARLLDKTTMSWMAVPLVNLLKGEVEGVLYFDCRVADYFDQDRQRAIAFASVGIAYFVALRYS